MPRAPATGSGKKRSRTYRSAARTSPGVKTTLKALGVRVRALRIAAGLTQEQAGERAEIDMRHWQLVEYGRTNPTVATLVTIARALGVTIGELFDKDPGGSGS